MFLSRAVHTHTHTHTLAPEAFRAGGRVRRGEHLAQVERVALHPNVFLGAAHGQVQFTSTDDPARKNPELIHVNSNEFCCTQVNSAVQMNSAINSAVHLPEFGLAGPDRASH